MRAEPTNKTPMMTKAKIHWKAMIFVANWARANAGSCQSTHFRREGTGGNLHNDRIARATPMVQSLNAARKNPPTTMIPQITMFAKIRAGRFRA